MSAWIEEPSLAAALGPQWQYPAGALPVVVALVEVDSQQLGLYKHQVLQARYFVSTASAGRGAIHGSGCTPTGWHRIAAKIGHESEIGAVFRGRVATGEIASELSSNSEDDLITTRILWLDGLEAGRNQGGQCDSYSRYIYVHGTAQEHLLGRPVSHGCVRMNNRDIVELFAQIEVDDAVFIR